MGLTEKILEEVQVEAPAFAQVPWHHPTTGCSQVLQLAAQSLTRMAVVYTMLRAWAASHKASLAVEP